MKKLFLSLLLLSISASAASEWVFNCQKGVECGYNYYTGLYNFNCRLQAHQHIVKVLIYTNNYGGETACYALGQMPYELCSDVVSVGNVIDMYGNPAIVIVGKTRGMNLSAGSGWLQIITNHNNMTEHTGCIAKQIQ